MGVKTQIENEPRWGSGHLFIKRPYGGQDTRSPDGDQDTNRQRAPIGVKTAIDNEPQ